MKCAWAMAAVVLASTAFPVAAQEKAKKEAKPKEGVALTVYSSRDHRTDYYRTRGYAVVREVRTLTVGKDGTVEFDDVAAHIDPTTVVFKSYTDPRARILEQNFQYNLVSVDALMVKHIGQRITGRVGDKEVSGILLSYESGYDRAEAVLKRDDGGLVATVEGLKEVSFPTLPGGLRTKPALLWKMATDKPGPHLSEVMYQTANIEWHAEYSLCLHADDSAGDLSGWVSVRNQSGKIYRDAKLKLIAGDITIPSSHGDGDSDGLFGDDDEDSLDSEEPMQEKPFFEYHMYTLPRPSTLANNETKQLEMIAPVRGVKIRKRYLYNPLESFTWKQNSCVDEHAFDANTVSKKISVWIEFINSKSNGLGIPMPAGTIRLYKKDTDGSMEFVGGNRIDHTPTDETIRLQIGNAFDLVGERKETDNQSEMRASGLGIITETIEFRVRNRKKEPVEVRIKEPMYRGTNWKILKTSNPKYTKLDARTIAWDVPVPAGGETVVTYTVQYTW